jgi:hypothetical protein
METKIIIEALAKAIKDGKMTIDSVPNAYKEQVEELLKEDNEGA